MYSVFLSHSPPYFWRQCLSLTELGTHCSVWACLSPPINTGVTDVGCHPSFRCLLEIWTQPFTLSQQAPYSLSHPPSLSSLLWKWGLSLNLDLTDLARLAGQPPTENLLSLFPQCEGYTSVIITRVLIWLPGVLHSGSCACMADILLRHLLNLSPLLLVPRYYCPPREEGSSLIHYWFWINGIFRWHLSLWCPLYLGETKRFVLFKVYLLA